MESDSHLITASRAGDTAAFGQLVDRYQRILFGMAMGRLGDEFAAREATVDALSQAYMSLAQLREPERFGSWLKSILHRGCLRRLRDGSRTTRLDPDVSDDSMRPDHLLEQREVGGELRAALRQLSPILRESVVLHYFMGFSVKEIAGFLEVPEGTVKRRLHDARGSMRSQFKDAPVLFTIQLREEIKMEISNKDLTRSSIEYANMVESTIRNVDFTGSTFEHVNISGTSFRSAGGGDGTPAKGLTFEHCTMQESEFRKVDLSGCSFEEVNLRGAKLQGCQLDGMTINGIEIEKLLARAE